MSSNITFTVSANGTTVVAPSSQTLTDENGNIWSFGSLVSSQVGYKVLENGTQFAAGVGVELAIKNGVVYALNGVNQWYMSTATGWTAEATGPVTASPPPTFTVSANGTTVVAPSSQTLTDENGNIWSFGSLVSSQVGYKVLENGTQFAAGVGVELAIKNGVVYALNGVNQWYMSTATGWTAEATGPVTASPPPTFTVSANGTTVVAPSSQTLTDENGNIWSFGSLVSSQVGYKVLENGTQFAAGVGVELAIKNGVVYALNGVNQWYMSTATGWTAEATGPVTASPPPTFTVSANGTTVVAPSSQTLTDENGNIWSFGSLVSSQVGYKVLENGTQFAAGVGVELAIKNGVVYALNGVNQWYMSTATGWTAEATGPVTASPPPTFTVSANGTTVVAPSSQTLTDENGNIWSFGSLVSSQVGYKVLENGTQFAAGVGVELAIKNGVVYALNGVNQWYMSTATGWTAEATGPVTASPPPTFTVSANGTTVVAPSSQTLTDENGNIWSFGSLVSSQVGYKVLENGTQFAAGVGVELAIKNGVVYALNGVNQWYMSTATGWTAEATGPVTASPPPTFTVSANGTTVVAPSSQTLTDENGNIWSFGSLVSSQVGYKVLENGTQFAAGVGVELAIKNGVVYALNGVNQWYMSTATGWTAEATGPVTASPPPTFTVSANGTTVVAPSSQTLTDENGNIWSFGSLVSSQVGYKVLENGTQFAAGVGVELAIKNGVVYALNGVNQWYMSTATGWTAEATGPVTASPPPTFTVSANGTTVVAPSSQTLTDENGNIWSFGSLVSSQVGYKVLENGTQFAAGVGVELAIKNGVVYALNSVNQWYMSTLTGWTYASWITTFDRLLTVAPDSSATPINIQAPSSGFYSPSQLTETVEALPGDGTVLLSDGVTPVTVGKTMTMAQLTTLKFAPTPGISEQEGLFTYAVTDPVGNTWTGEAAFEISPPPPPTVFNGTLTVAPNSAATPLNMQSPTDGSLPGSQLSIVVNSLPNDGAIFLSDGVTPVTLGESLSVAQLTGLQFQPTTGLSGQNSSIVYIVTNSAGLSEVGTEALQINGPSDTQPTVAPSSAAASSSPATQSTYSAIGPNGNYVGSTITESGVGAGASVGEILSNNVVDITQNMSMQQIQNEINNAVAGTTFIFEGGSYNIVGNGIQLGANQSGDAFIGTNGAILDGGSSALNLFSINGANDVTIEGLSLQNTSQNDLTGGLAGTWNYNSWSYSSAADYGTAITAFDSSGDNFEYNTIQNASLGIGIAGGGSDTVQGNYINNVQQATYLTGDSNGIATKKDIVSSNLIDNVKNINPDGNFDNFIAAVSLFPAEDTTVSNNVIENVYGFGIATGGSPSAINNAIFGNSILNTDTAAPFILHSLGDDYGLDLNPDDSGAISIIAVGSAATNEGLVLANNFINNYGIDSFNIGIRLEASESGITITGNIVKDAVVPATVGGYGQTPDFYGGIATQDGNNDVITNNVFDVTGRNANAHNVGGIMAMDIGFGDYPNLIPNTDSGDRVSGNIMYDGVPQTWGGGDSWPIGNNNGSSADDANLLQVTSGNFYFGLPKSTVDKGPISGGPEFVNPATNDYQLQSGSLAAPLYSSGTFATTDTIPNGGSLDLGADATVNVAYAGVTGALGLDQSLSFAGTVSGFRGQDQIDLADIAFGANSTLGYAPNAGGSGGVLTASDGVHVARLALLGQYAASSFVIASDGHGGTLITDPPPPNEQNTLAQPIA